MASGKSSMELFLARILLLLEQVINGYRFSPNEEELINHLKSKVPGCRGGFCIIPKIENIYEINPSDLPAKFREKSIIPSKDREWWFICPQTPQTQNQRTKRKTPCGSSWKITGTRKDVIIGSEKIGSKTTLAFPDSRGTKSGKSDWIIREYRLPTKRSEEINVLCHLKDVKADNSTTTSEHGVIDLEKLESILKQLDDDVSFPEIQKLIQAKMKSLMDPSQHQNQVQLSLSDLLLRFKRWLQSQSNTFLSSIHQFTNFGSPSFKDLSLDNSTIDRSNELGSSLRTTKDEWFDPMPNADRFHEVQKGEEPRLEKVQQETTARNIEPCRSLDETAAREKEQDGEVANSTTESEVGAIYLARLEFWLNQPDDEGSFPEDSIQAKMKSLAEPSQH